MWKKLVLAVAVLFVGAVAAVTGWIAFPTKGDHALAAPLQAMVPDGGAAPAGPYASDYAILVAAFREQGFRSFCGPATLATLLRAYGVKDADQQTLFPSVGSKIEVFYNGLTLPKLAALAQETGLRAEAVHADTVDFDAFRTRLKENLARTGDFVVVNYDRRVLQQEGSGHISAVGAYDDTRDAFLVLDQAAYNYPFTWVPASLLYEAVNTRDGERFRGILLVQSYTSPG
jgi:hypothetical protein